MNYMGVFYNKLRLYFLILLLFISCFQLVMAQSPSIENIDKLNSPSNERDLVFSNDGNVIYFTRESYASNLGGKADKGDIWYATKDDQGQWTEPENIGKPLNNNQRNAVAGFSDDGDIMYLHYLYSKSGKSSTQGISRSVKKGGKWSFPEKVNIPYFYNKSDHLSLCVSQDGKIMLMAIASYGSYGLEDLYVSFKKKDHWTEPMNLGNSINTRFQEMTPYLAADNVTLYFASNGHGGLGSRDIYISQRLDNSWKSWSKPKNLGRPVNSEGVELSYIFSPTENYAYFISTQNSNGYGDIYRTKIGPEEKPDDIEEGYLVQEEFNEPDTIIVISRNSEPILEASVDSTIKEDYMKEEVPRIEGRVMNKLTNEPIKATLTFEDDDGGIVKTVKTGNEGNYIAELPNGQYTVHVSATGYLAKEDELSTYEMAGPLFNKEFYLSPLDVGTTVQLENVLFKRGTANMLKGSEGELDQVVLMLKENPEMRIKISGHTDNRGDFKLNIKLSRERAKTVEEYLIDTGIDPKRLKVKGYGGTRPIASNSTESTRKLNRRVEFTVLDVGE